MNSLIVNSDQIKLPAKFISKLKGKKIKLSETERGILITPVEDPINKLRGVLKNSKLTSKSFMRNKVIEKKLEDE